MQMIASVERRHLSGDVWWRHLAWAPSPRTAYVTSHAAGLPFRCGELLHHSGGDRLRRLIKSKKIKQRESIGSMGEGEGGTGA